MENKPESNEKNIEEIEPLSNEEILTLQVDSALRKVGELDKALVEINRTHAEKLEKFGKARIELEIVKAKKEIIIERSRNLKTFIKGSQVNL